ncbi:MAG: type II toxin-antitoxin system HicA family toxin [Clostridia bacterium]|nr:type II toxin-antitoxin system HicA family toxin [Clostridia bacterium]
MKRKDLIKLLEQNGWYLKRHGANHDVYTDGTQKEMIPRHTEVNEQLAQAIIKRRGLK